MSLNLNNGQKSPKRRFLLILGVVTFICVTIIGIMIMFWDRMNLPLTPLQRYAFGGFFILYGIVRFSRLLKKDDSDE
jgi:prolipoprotein diacylglyceryltransferase